MTKRLLISALFCTIFHLTYSQNKPAATKSDSSFTVTLKTPSYKSGLAYLCYHMGKNLNIQDSSIVSEKGVAVFKGNNPMPGGIYAIVFPGKLLTFDFFVDKEKEFTILADTANLQNVVIKGGTAENDLFKDYQKFVTAKGTLLQKERMAYIDARTKADSTIHENNYNKYNKQLIDYRDSVIKNFPASMMTLMLNAMKEPEIINKNPKTRQDTLDNYNYYKAHYWDGVSFTDDRVIRTPFFLPKLERYYRDIVPQAPDSLIKDLDYKLLLARVCPEMYKFLLNWFTDEYINPKIMGQDAVFVHLFEKYHSKGVSYWLNEKQQETISRRAYMQMSNLIGVKASNLEMVDTAGKPKNLYDVPAEYTLVIFWDPTCGHCKTEVPQLDSIYRASWKANGIRIYAVLNDNERKKEWIEFINEHKIRDWVNVYETPEREKQVSDNKEPSYRQLFDVTQTPTILLLDKEKRIVCKKLGLEQLNDFLKTKWSQKKD